MGMELVYLKTFTATLIKIVYYFVDSLFKKLLHSGLFSHTKISVEMTFSIHAKYSFLFLIIEPLKLQLLQYQKNNKTCRFFSFCMRFHLKKYHKCGATMWSITILLFFRSLSNSRFISIEYVQSDSTLHRNVFVVKNYQRKSFWKKCNLQR